MHRRGIFETVQPMKGAPRQIAFLTRFECLDLVPKRVGPVGKIPFLDHGARKNPQQDLALLVTVQVARTSREPMCARRFVEFVALDQRAKVIAILGQSGRSRGRAGLQSVE